jgi:hypothetical protein
MPLFVPTISLWEPWASAILHKLKRVETRGRGIKKRGWIAIQAAQTREKASFIHHTAPWPYFRDAGITTAGHLHFGKVICIAYLEDCQPTEKLAPNITAQERIFGDYSPGRFGWIFSEILPVQPIPWKGSQGWFGVPAELFKFTDGAPVFAPGELKPLRLGTKLKDAWKS